MKKSIITVAVLSSLYFYFLGFAQAQLSPAFTARLDKVFDSMCTKLKIKGASAALLVPDGGTWKGVHGISRAGVPINSDMVFGIGSNTKPFVSACMLKLQEAGKLNLDDTIGKWIINKPNISGKITIRQLLNHSSGLFDYTQNPGFFDSINASLTRYWKKEDVLHLVETPNFTPGLKWDYSNTNYLLAGIIIEKVTGKSIEAALREQVIAPAGLTHTYYYPFEMPSPVRADQWSMDFGTGKMIDPELTFNNYSPISMFSMAASAGCIMQTAEDNVQFWHKLTSGGIINAASFDQMRQYLSLGGGDGYGLGLFFYSKSLNGRSFYSHGGTFIGYINENMVDTTSHICISVLTNQDSIDNNRLLGYVIGAMHKVTLQMKTTDIREVQNNAHFVLYPNPASNILNITSDDVATEGTISICDISGVQQLSQSLLANDSQVDLANLASGYYIASITDSNGRVLHRQKICIAR